jgi:hypothetical protein
MNPPEQDSGDLADLISRLCRHGRRVATSRSARGSAQAASQETPQPLADSLQHLLYEQIVRMDRRLPGASPTDPGMQEG